ncbi:MAG: efflux RND transporter periplasmic adaptor subunit [Desulfobacter postgatei]|uniref:efflux RND transporter periplasmic adaptor subunit n=1 Tax=Desulfobacter postgatei TaxID=2293 RepID=UPI0023F20EB5|nr:efflux RND transporter periplasmic adaptor subunit [Desulfobacter postgatei]MDD4275332.1 efflux RND transporter periplasmic adaptor subunit [Desulfobacter postgatei]
MPSFLFRLMRVVAVLLFAAGVALWLFVSREKPQKKEMVNTPPKVLCVPAVSGNADMIVEAFGTVMPRNSVKLAMEIAGRIDYVHPDFREGASIHKDEIFLRIDQRTLLLNERNARVLVDQARADIRLLEQEISNLKADAGLAPSRMALKKSALASEQAALATASLMLEKSEIKSGFYGFVMAKQVEVGEYVNPGQVLGVMYEKDALDVDIRVPLEELQWLGSVFENGVRPQVIITIANLEGDRSPVWPGHVVRIKAAIDEKTRTMPMTVEIGSLDVKDPLLLLRPGVFVKCRVKGEQKENVFKIPRTLMRSPNTLYLAKANHLVIKTVKVIRRFEEDVYITEGLTPGDLIIESRLPGNFRRYGNHG